MTKKIVRPFLKRFLKRFVIPVVDLFLVPFLVIAAAPMRVFRKIGPQFAPRSRAILRRMGVWPLRRHYYDPLFHPGDLSKSLHSARTLGGIDWNMQEQLTILRQMTFAEEFRAYLNAAPTGKPRYRLDNNSFLSGDADYLYNFIRLFKPRRVIEVGCGNSTLVMRAAEIQNQNEDPAQQCVHTCIEPYENPWLDEMGITVVRERVETMDIEQFRALQSGDLLFIDSSHMVRPTGDVTFEILEVLPALKPGVFVHFHDVFSPREYLQEWILDRVYQWNEQYLLEAFLSFNVEFKVIGALNLLHHRCYDELAAICVQYDRSREPGSLYIQRRPLS